MMSLELLRHRCVRIYQSYLPEPLTQAEHQEVTHRLSGELLSLFYSQPLCDQRHGLLVYEKMKDVFRDTDIDDKDLFISACFHDYAKTFCRFNVTQRVIVATLLGFVPVEKHENLRASRYKIIRRIGTYVDHAQLSWEAIEPYCDSEFVRAATLYHHGYPKDISIDNSLREHVEMFVKADTL